MLPKEQLIQAAQEARSRAYAPYSNYLVGVALETDQGQVCTGCNVENISYGASICAERTAVTRMVAEGSGTSILQIAVASLDGVTPCGICRQVLSEFVPTDGDVWVHCVSEDGKVESYAFHSLLPHAFASSAVPRTDSKR